MTGSEGWTRVCAEDDIPLLEGRRVEVGGFPLGVFNTEGGFYAVYDVCPHRGGPLSDGDVAGAVVTCPLHARKIDLRSGEVLNDEGLSCTSTFPVKVEDGSVYLGAQALSSLGAASAASAS